MTDVDSKQAFRYVLACFTVAGLFSRQNNRNAFYNFYRIIVISMSTVLYPVCSLINLFTQQQLNTLLSNISVGLNLISSAVKGITVFVLRQSFFEIEQVVEELDKRLLDEDARECVRVVTKQCQWISLGYLGSYLLVLVMYAVSSLVTMEHLIFPTWFPFDWRTSRFKFAAAFCYQFVSASYQILQMSAYDIFPTIYIKILTAHVKALAARIEKVGWDSKKDDQENYDDLVSCVKDHILVLRYFDIVKTVISLTIFYQFIVAAFIMCTTAAYVVFLNEGFLNNVSVSVYLIAVILQVLPCCYYIDEFITESSYLTTAVYNCNWASQDEKFRKVVIIFMLRTQKEHVIVAGNLIPVSLDTFLRMVKFSYSVFAILGQIND